VIDMGGGQQELKGPDLSSGVPIADVADGGMLLGHAAGEAVLLARRGDEVFAIGATCTHYSGPLAEGLLVEDTVRCPWHHACFSLRTGEPVGAPALNPVACWRVERDGERVRVTEKLERDPLAPSAEAARGVTRTRASEHAARVVAPSEQPPADIVIVGAGAAGSAAAEMLRRLGYSGRITMLDAGPDAPYDRPNLSKDYLAGNAPEDWIPLRPPGFYASHDIQLVHDAEVTALDLPRRQVETAGGGTHRFDRLLLATGADPVRLPLPGADRPHVHYLRTLADSRAIIARAKTSRRAVVIGASFIGLEVAAALRAREIEVHVVAPERLPLERVMGTELARFVKSLHEEHGVVFHLEDTVTAIGDADVTLKGGGTLAADLVVIGVGVRPRLALAEQAKLTMDRGVSVNERLETSAPHVFAAGDIARYPDPYTGERIRVEHWVHAQRQGQAAARNMLGVGWPYDDVPFFWSAHYDVSINYVGHAERWDAVEVDGDPAARDVAVRFKRAGQTLAVASIFRDAESLAAEVEMERRHLTSPMSHSPPSTPPG
jgi:NADPH-dependent 2,4-dienoyl-CoA reductase/sulfur reductase-like enzyme/nitrite reductase/ring-hydroxylating ferredoxin subunit